MSASRLKPFSRPRKLLAAKISTQTKMMIASMVKVCGTPVSLANSAAIIGAVSASAVALPPMRFTM